MGVKLGERVGHEYVFRAFPIGQFLNYAAGPGPGRGRGTGDAEIAYMMRDIQCRRLKTRQASTQLPYSQSPYQHGGQREKQRDHG
eukprot:scaffold16107_cov67-Phaeocystis_antarctica.AAC.6